MSRKSFRGIPAEELSVYLGPKQLERLYARYGASRVNLAIHELRVYRGHDCG